MYPELFNIPFTELTVKSYGLMMVIGFLGAVFLIRRLSRNITPDPQLITNAALYSLIAGVVGARLFYVVHYPEMFRDDPLSVFAIWKGGLELLGGVVLAITVIILYLRYHKLPVRRYLDILAIGLMLALVFGRIGCFLNGCCFGKPTDLPWAVCFPYGSLPYHSQTSEDLGRGRDKPYLQLPSDFFGYYYEDGKRFFGCRSERKRLYGLKPYKDLTEDQKEWLEKSYKKRSLPVHPTELYSSVNAAFLCLILYLFWRRFQNTDNSKNTRRLFSKPGCTFGLMFVIYGVSRFFMEFVRDDNPFEYSWWAIYKGATVSQNLGIYLAVLGIILMLIFQRMKPKAIDST